MSILPQSHPRLVEKRSSQSEKNKMLPLKNRQQDPFVKRVAAFEMRSKQFEKERIEKVGKFKIQDYFSERPDFIYSKDDSHR